MNWLTSIIDKEFENKFSFLKLLEINYDKENKQCLITFLYPETKDFDDKSKDLVTELIKKHINLSATINVKYKKSYLDDDLIERNFFEIVKNEFPSIYALSDNTKLKIERDFNNINVFFDLDANSSNYLNEDVLKNKLKLMLETRFCCEFTVNLNKIESNIDEKIILRSHENVFTQKTPRYEVEVKQNLFGGEICPKPEFIKYIKEEKTSVILAGKIENLLKKSYESKKEKTKGQLKYYYTFELNDSNSRIEVKYFSTISNEKKMDKLLNGDEVIILGDIKSFNKKLSLYIKAISRCIMPEKVEVTHRFTNEFEFVKPENYSVLSQDNLFKKKPKYSEDLYKNTYVVFDVETTGLDHENNELIEIGAVKIQDGTIISKFNSLIKPVNPIPNSATLINNITNAMVEHCPTVDVVIRDFYRFSQQSILVGYNVSFDQRFIQQAAKKQGLSFDNEFVDVLPIARAKLCLTKYRLADVVKRLKIDLEGAHRALADSLATAEVFLELNSSNYA